MQTRTPKLASPRRTSPTCEIPYISVLVPVRNEARHIASTLEQLLVQDYPVDRFEILVADGLSEDDTPTIVKALMHRHPNLRLLPNPGKLSSAGRNVAARAARGDILVLIDGHCEIRSVRYLADLADAFLRSGADCVGRPQPLDVTGASPLQLAIASARASRLGHHPASHIYSEQEGLVAPDSVAVAYRREVFARVGYFDETFDACEDVEFNHRLAQAGLRCWFSPRAAVHYVPRDSLIRLYRQMVRYGRGRIRLLCKHRDTLSLASLVPALFVAGLLVGPVLAGMMPALWWVYLGTLMLYTSLVVVTSIGLAVRQGRLALLPWLPAVFATVHLGAGAGAWWELLTGPFRSSQS